MILFYLLYGILAAISIVRCLRWSQHLLLGSFPHFAFTGAMVKLAENSWKLAVPFQYMLFPPTVAERAELVEQDEHGVYRAKKGPPDVAINQIWWTEVVELLIIYLSDWR